MAEAPPFTFGYKTVHNLLLCKGTGLISVEAGVQMLEAIKDLEDKGAADLDRFYDFTAITGIDLEYHDIAGLAARRKRDRRDKPPIKSAFLVSDPLIFGTMRTYGSFMDKSGLEVFVSYKIEELAEFLGVSADQLALP